jgi:hypothetical protein
MWLYLPAKSLKNKLILSFEKNMIDTTESSLTYTMTVIEKQLKQAEQLSDWIFINRSLDNILTKKYPRYSAEINNFLDLVNNYQLGFNSSIGTYTYSLLIHGNNGLDLRAGQPDGQIDLDKLKKQAWFQKGLRLHGQKFWYGLVENPSTAQYEKYLLPALAPA